MSEISLARSFFEDIVKSTGPVAAIRALVNPSNPTFETDWLDFKLEDRDPKQRDKKYRQQLCEALSGFANNRGGVIIWGIEAKKHSNNGVQIDAASAERPIANPIGIKSRLIELCRQAVDPPLMNVEFEAFPCPDAPETGFVVCFIPEGEFKPYRTDEGRDSQFYLRAVDSFFVMSRSVIQAMFYPRLKALFRIRISLTRSLKINMQRPAGRSPQTAHARWKVDIVNTGNASAKDVVIQMKSSVDWKSVNANGTDWWGGPESWRAKFAIHPCDSVQLAVFEHEPRAMSKAAFADSPVRLTFDILCENHGRQRIVIEQPLEGDWNEMKETTEFLDFGSEL